MLATEPAFSLPVSAEFAMESYPQLQFIKLVRLASISAVIFFPVYVFWSMPLFFHLLCVLEGKAGHEVYHSV